LHVNMTATREQQYVPMHSHIRQTPLAMTSGRYFRGVTRGNAVPVVEKLQERMGIWEVCIYNLKFSSGVIPLDPAERPRCPYPDWCHGDSSPAFPLFLFYEMTTGHHPLHYRQWRSNRVRIAVGARRTLCGELGGLLESLHTGRSQP